MKLGLDDYVLVSEAAKVLGVSGSRVRILAGQGRFPGACLKGRVWFIPQSSVQDYARSPRHPGRPRHQMLPLHEQIAKGVRG